jgi:hypothetical protein
MSLAVNRTMEAGMMKAITQTAQFLDQEKTLEIVGPNNVTAVAKFSGQDLRGIRRVNLLIQNPLMLFAGGRQKIAEDYMKIGLIQTPEQYDAVMVYGSLEPIREKSLTKENLVSWENQQMRQGEPVYALATDDHAYHIYKHTILENDPEIRRRPELLKIIDDHKNEHLRLSREVDVGLYAMAQTGKNLPPDQNTPTGMPEQAPMDGQMQQPSGNLEGAEMLTEDSQGAEAASPANPVFDLGEV